MLHEILLEMIHNNFKAHKKQNVLLTKHASMFLPNENVK